MPLTTTQPKAITPAKLEAELVNLDQGLKANIAVGTVLTIGGIASEQPEIDTMLQGWIATFKAVETAKQQYQDALAARLAITVQARTFAKGLKAVVRELFGPQSAVLASFGIATDHPVSTTAQQKLVASAKRSQTRKVRGTKGKKQRAAITVIGNPPISVASDGSVQISPPPVNAPADETPTGGSTPSTK